MATLPPVGGRPQGEGRNRRLDFPRNKNTALPVKAQKTP